MGDLQQILSNALPQSRMIIIYNTHLILPFVHVCEYMFVCVCM